MSHHQDNHHDMMICEGGRGAFKSKSTYSEASHTQSAELQNYEKNFRGNLFMKNWTILFSVSEILV